MRRPRGHVVSLFEILLVTSALRPRDRIGSSSTGSVCLMPAKIELERNLDALEPMFALLDSELELFEVDDRTAYGMKLAAEELFTNLVRHNTTGGETISLRLEFSDERLDFELVDHDVDPFEADSIPRYDKDLSMEERSPGGVGVYLVRSIVDRVSYEYDNREMKVSVTKYRREPAKDV